jgi:hypothetical protein
MKYTIELFEDPDRWSRWDVIEWGEHRNPIDSKIDSKKRQVGKVIHSEHGNTSTTYSYARAWLDNYKKENGIE